jgi:hypothetical protein
VPQPDNPPNGDDPTFLIAVTGAAESFAVVVRGNAALVKQIVTTADWTKLAAR